MKKLEFQENLNTVRLTKLMIKGSNPRQNLMVHTILIQKWKIIKHVYSKNEALFPKLTHFVEQEPNIH